jgi:hypothetical protein
LSNVSYVVPTVPMCLSHMFLGFNLIYFCQMWNTIPIVVCPHNSHVSLNVFLNYIPYVLSHVFHVVPKVPMCLSHEFLGFNLIWFCQMWNTIPIVVCLPQFPCVFEMSFLITSHMFCHMFSMLFPKFPYPFHVVPNCPTFSPMFLAQSPTHLAYIYVGNMEKARPILSWDSDESIQSLKHFV